MTGFGTEGANSSDRPMLRCTAQQRCGLAPQDLTSSECWLRRAKGLPYATAAASMPLAVASPMPGSVPASRHPDMTHKRFDHAR